MLDGLEDDVSTPLLPPRPVKRGRMLVSQPEPATEQLQGGEDWEEWEPLQLKRKNKEGPSEPV